MEILKMSLWASVFILAIIIIRALALHRLPKMTFLVLWVAALFRLLVPFAVPSNFSIFTLADMLNTHSSMDTSVTGMTPINFSTAADTINTSLAKTVSANSSPFMAVWLIGLLACALFFIITHLRWRREYKTALPVDNEFVRVWQRSHPTRRRVEIRQSDRIAVPLVYGIFRPVILLPKATDWTNEKRLEYILAHELVHIRRFDTLMKLLLAAAVCVHWFNPLVWVMYVLASRDIELSCDEAVVRTFGEAVKSAYALTLIGLEEKRSRILPLVNNFSKNAIEERIVSIMKMKKITIITLVAAAVIVIGTTTAFATTAKSDMVNSNAAVSATQSSSTTAAPTSTAVPMSSEDLANMQAALPSAKPIAEDALPAYWKMGALNVDGVPYLPLIATAESLGYTVNITSKKCTPDYIPQYPNAVEYSYEIVKDGKSIGIACIDIADGKIVQYDTGGIYCNTHDWTDLTNTVCKFLLQKDVVYMPAQFFKEALDTGNTLP